MLPHGSHSKSTPAESRIPVFSSESQISEETCIAQTGTRDNDVVPLFVDPRYVPSNVRRREKRKDTKVQKLRKELKALKKTLINKDTVISNLQRDIETIRRKSEKSKARLIKQYNLAVLDFAKLDAELADQTSDEEEMPIPSTMSKEPQLLFTFDTKQGKKYSAEIRTLYYSLLASQIPPGKIRRIIKDVLIAFVPGVDVESLQLPAESCANYMRREELKTLCMAHQATLLSQADKLYLNSDGTTKNQHKLNAIAFNGVVISVNEVPDGKADSIIADIDSQLKKLRCFAQQLDIPNNEMLNWSMISASTSDSASTQKRLNDLIQQRKEEDTETLPLAGNESLDIVRNFCAMHLGVNLRRAFVTAQTGWQEAIDTFVYEFCKLFGSHATPEYAVHIQFQDFLRYRISQMDDNQAYYQTCLNVSLSRQIGSRYFVTSHNATKVLFLTAATTEFLTFTNKSDGNKLEKDVFCKLTDSSVLELLKIDALMYHHVYADLVMLAKSRELEKSVYDMREHYLELKLYLEKLEEYPETIRDRYYKVFSSESRLYCDARINHRNHKHECTAYECIQEHLFQSLPASDHSFYSKVAAGSSSMKKKLCTYAMDFLPDGLYWDPDAETVEILKDLEPSNDLCESILGLNDYLCTALPNLVQLTKSNLIEVKKNHTMKWFNELPKERQNTIIELAVKRRKEVREDFKEMQKIVSKKRQVRMLEQKKKADYMRKKQTAEMEKLSSLHLITSVTEFETVLSNIKDEGLSTRKENEKILNLLKEQVRIRKKLLKQKTSITFTSNGRKRPLSLLVAEVQELIGDSPVSGDHADSDPHTLVGKTIMHKFLVDNEEEQWFSGFVLDYDGETHHIKYEDSSEIFHFNLMEDLSQGDLRVLTDY